MSDSIPTFKRYTFVVDGVTKFRNVPPEKEHTFFEKYGQYNPTLVPHKQYKAVVDGKEKIFNVSPEKEEKFFEAHGDLNPELISEHNKDSNPTEDHQIDEDHLSSKIEDTTNASLKQNYRIINENEVQVDLSTNLSIGPIQQKKNWKFSDFYKETSLSEEHYQNEETKGWRFRMDQESSSPNDYLRVPTDIVLELERINNLSKEELKKDNTFITTDEFGNKLYFRDFQRSLVQVDGQYLWQQKRYDGTLKMIDEEIVSLLRSVDQGGTIDVNDRRPNQSTNRLIHDIIDIDNDISWEQTAPNLVAELTETLGDDKGEFTIEVLKKDGHPLWQMEKDLAINLGLRHDFNWVRITHKESGEIVDIPAGIAQATEFKRNLDYVTIPGTDIKHQGPQVGQDFMGGLFTSYTVSEYNKQQKYLDNLNEAKGLLYNFLNKHIDAGEDRSMLLAHHDKIIEDFNSIPELQINEEDLSQIESKYSLHRYHEDGEVIRISDFTRNEDGKWVWKHDGKLLLPDGVVDRSNPGRNGEIYYALNIAHDITMNDPEGRELVGDELTAPLEFNTDIFNPIVTKGRYGWTHVEQPHEEIIDQAEMELTMSAKQIAKTMGTEFKEPTKEQIYNRAREILVQKKQEDLIQGKWQRYLDSSEVEGPWYDSAIDPGGSINELRAAWNLKTRREVEEILKSRAEGEAWKNKFEKQIGTIEEPKNQLKEKLNFEKALKDPNFSWKLEPGQYYYEIEGKKVPVKVYDRYVTNSTYLETMQNDYLAWHDKSTKLFEKVEFNAFKSDLIRRDYDDIKKFIGGIGLGFSDIVVGSAYAVEKSFQYVAAKTGDEDYLDTGWKGKELNKKFLDYEFNQRLKREFYQKDVAFEDAFRSPLNFGKFVAQEFSNQTPIFASLMIPYAGITSLMLSSGAQNYANMLRDEEMFGSSKSFDKKFWTSVGYGVAEGVFDKFITKRLMMNSFRALSSAPKQIIKGWAGAKLYFRNNYKGFITGAALESASEIGTITTQNILNGKPITTNLGHSAFSGAMFGTIFGGAPVIKGTLAASFSPTQDVLQYNNLLNETGALQEMLDTNADLSSEVRSQLQEQINEGHKKMKEILDTQLNKMDEMSSEWTDAFLYHYQQSREIEIKAKQIQQSDLSRKEKNKELNKLTLLYNAHQKTLEVLKDGKNFGDAFTAFMTSEKPSDVKKREDVLNEAAQNLMNGSPTYVSGEWVQNEQGQWEFKESKTQEITNPTDEQIRREAEMIWGRERINSRNKDFKSTDFTKSHTHYQTVQEAISAIQAMENLTDAQKKSLISNIAKGGHGGQLTLDDGTFISIEVVENMVKGGRYETRTHELGHAAFIEAITANPEAYAPLADEIIQFLRNNNEGAFNVLKMRTNNLTMNTDEIIMIFMEMIAEKKVNLKSKNNKGLAARVVHSMFSSFRTASNSNVEYNFEGETDAINFLNQLAKKLQNGTLEYKDIESIKKSPVITDLTKEEQSKIDEQVKKSAKPSFDAKPDINALIYVGGKVMTKEEWDNEGWRNALNEIKKKRSLVKGKEQMGYLDALILAKHKAPYVGQAIPETWVDDVLNSTYFINHLKNFNPEVNNDLFGYINSQLKNKAGNVYNVFDVKIKTTTLEDQRTDGPVRQIEDTSYNLEKETDAINYWDKKTRKENKESVQRESTFRKEIGIGKLGKSEIISKVKKALAISKSFKNETDFLESFETELVSILFPTMQRTFREASDFIKFRKAILESIPITTLVQMQKQLPKEIRFVEKVIRATNKNVISDFVYGTNETGKNPKKEKLLPSEILNDSPISRKRRAAGVPVYRRVETSTAAWEKYIHKEFVGSRQKSTKSGTKTNIKTKILSESAKAIGKDAAPEALTPQFVKDYITRKDIKNITPTQNEIFTATDKIVKEEQELAEKEGRVFNEDRFLSRPAVREKIMEHAKYLNVVNNISELIDRPSDLKFSEKAKANIISVESIPMIESNFVDDEWKTVDVLVSRFVDGGVYKHRTAKEIDQYFKDIETVIVPMLTPEVLTYGFLFKSDRILGNKANRKKELTLEDGTKINVTDYYKKKREELFAKELNWGKPFTGAAKLYKYGTTYANYFGKTAKDIQAANTDGKLREPKGRKIKQTIAEINEMHRSMHEQFWQRVNESIQQNPANIKVWGNYFQLVGQDVNHPHRMGAEMVGWSPNPKGVKVKRKVKGKVVEHTKYFEWEHAMPATRAYLYLLNASIGGLDFNASYELIMRDFKLIALDAALDLKLKNAGRATNMGKGWKLLNNSWLDRYFHPDVVAVRGGINPAAINHVDGGTFADVYKINADGNPIGFKPSSKIKESQASLQADINRVKNSSKPRGASIFDFDDTLGFTKSGVRVTLPNMDGQPKPKKKVIFLAGGAGSGKGNVVNKLGLEKMGFKIVNQDISLEWLKKNHGLPTDMRELTKEQRSILGKLGHQARQIAKRKMMKYQGQGNGVVVDGTGASLKQMEKLVAEFEAKGYDVSMLFVDTSLDVALARNRARKERSLLDVIVRKNHEAVQNNKAPFKKIFGKRFMEVNTDNLTQQSPMPASLVDAMNDFVISYEKMRLDAAEFAEQGDDILRRGGEFDFSEFNDVVDGKPGPLLEKARNRAKKYGTSNMFVLTARPQASAQAIHEFLKSQGLNIPIKNITGLANSTGNAKAKWVLEKFAEGYNDIYFADDATANVKAVKEVLDQLDIKSKVVQAKVKFSEKASFEFNQMIERKKKIDANRVYSYQEARKSGHNKGWFRIYIPPSAEDFKGLLYNFLGKGRQGDADMKFFKDNLLDPFAKGIRAWNTYKQNMVNDFTALKKKFPSVKRNRKVPLTNGLTVDTAIRVYLWTKAGFEVEGITPKVKQRLLEHVEGNADIKAFADGLSIITKRKEGYIRPSNNWMMETVTTDLMNIVEKVGRKEFLHEWINNKNIIFSKENLNKIEAAYGTWFRDALDNMLYRMENGGNKTYGKDKTVGAFTEWINNSVGAIMFFNMRSALLQTISTVNFINWHDNNIFKAAAAFANQKQFWSDFVMLFNSDQLKQRRKGLKTDVSSSELTKAFSEGGYNPRSVINYLLQKGFLPTQIADSFAIAFGGASMYRNRYNKYIKQGMDPKKAHEQAMLEFQEIAEETQQSSREDLVSQQQAGPLGRIILAFQNVTMQMGRLTKKAGSDLINRRRMPGLTQAQSDMTYISKIVYYGVVQNLVFAGLQTALFAIMWGDDEEEIKNREAKVANQALDSFLRGTGLYGALASTLKNVIIQWDQQSKKPYGQSDPSKIALELINLSPPIGSKVRKIVSAFKTMQYNKGVSEELGWRIENPKLHAAAAIIEGLTNIPLERVVRKANNLEEAITGNHQTWQRVMMIMGWAGWSLGVRDEELQEAKGVAKEKRKEIKKQERIEEKKQEEEDKKKQGFKKIRCSGTNSAGERCGLTSDWTKEKTWKCFHHMEFKDGMDRDGDGLKEYRCVGIKKNGDRCKNKTENKNKKCYAHQ